MCYSAGFSLRLIEQCFVYAFFSKVDELHEMTGTECRIEIEYEKDKYSHVTKVCSIPETKTGNINIKNENSLCLL